MSNTDIQLDGQQPSKVYHIRWSRIDQTAVSQTDNEISIIAPSPQQALSAWEAWATGNGIDAEFQSCTFVGYSAQVSLARLAGPGDVFPYPLPAINREPK